MLQRTYIQSEALTVFSEEDTESCVCVCVCVCLAVLFPLLLPLSLWDIKYWPIKLNVANAPYADTEGVIEEYLVYLYQYLHQNEK